MAFIRVWMTVVASLVAVSCVRPASSAFKAQNPSCATPALRKEVRSLSPDEWQRFVAAVKRMMERPTVNGRLEASVYDKLVKIQIDNYDAVQGYALHLPFYRWLLTLFETELRKIDPAVSLPYWDWVADASAPHQSPILSNAFLGGNGAEGKECVTSGAFAGFTTFYPEQGACLRRHFNRGNEMSPFPKAAAMAKALAEVTSFDTFRQYITYVPAGAVRRGIGGHMSSKAMANDPIFWLHMANVDKAWADWQAKSDKFARAVNGLLSNRTVARATTPIPPSPYTIGDVLAIKDLCYAYQASPADSTAGP